MTAGVSSGQWSAQLLPNLGSLSSVGAAATSPSKGGVTLSAQSWSTSSQNPKNGFSLAAAGGFESLPDVVSTGTASRTGPSSFVDFQRGASPPPAPPPLDLPLYTLGQCEQLLLARRQRRMVRGKQIQAARLNIERDLKYTSAGPGMPVIEFTADSCDAACQTESAGFLLGEPVDVGSGGAAEQRAGSTGAAEKGERGKCIMPRVEEYEEKGEWDEEDEGEKVAARMTEQDHVDPTPFAEPTEGKFVQPVPIIRYVENTVYVSSWGTRSFRG